MGQKISPNNSISNRISAIPRLTMNFVGRNNHVIAKNHVMQVLYKMKIYYIKNFHPMINSCYNVHAKKNHVLEIVLDEVFLEGLLYTLRSIMMLWCKNKQCIRKKGYHMLRIE